MQATQEAPFTDDVSRLKHQLAERELSVMRAILANTELQQKVADAEEESEKLKQQVVKLEQQPSPAEALAEIVRLKKEWSVTQRAQQREHAERRAELIKLRTQLHQVQKKYEDESRARRIEVAQSSAMMAKYERDVGDLRLEAKRSRDEQDRTKKSHWRFAAGAIIGLSAVCAIAFFTPWNSKSGAVPTDQVSPQATAASVIPAQTSKTPSPAGGLNAFSGGVNGPEFSRAVSRLSDALNAFPGHTPEEILRNVHLSRARQDPGLCSFQWNNGQPSLMFAGDKPNVTISSTLNGCAQAVEAYRQQKNAPASPPGH